MPEGCPRSESNHCLPNSHCLLIGNSRWHWAIGSPDGWRFEHTSPDPDRLAQAKLIGWAAVGVVPDHPVLRQSRRLGLADVPLQGLPPWLGVDRALAAWAAWGAASPWTHEGLLVADAGTVLSLTRVRADGRFAGGQLAAGFGLQLRAMAAGTRDLPDPKTLTDVPSALFPEPTLDAMQRGTVQSLLGLLLEAQHHCGWPLWLCGGDAPLLLEQLRERGADVRYAPDLVMQALVALLS
ncbi:MAG: type III pantothenate kinase [Synechococcus sp.]